MNRLTLGNRRRIKGDECGQWALPLTTISISLRCLDAMNHRLCYEVMLGMVSFSVHPFAYSYTLTYSQINF
jgi:hypothetical protein